MNEGNGTAPLYPVTIDDHAGWVVTTSIIFLIYSTLCVVAKILLRIKLQAFKTSIPDLTLLVALVLLFAQTVCIIGASNAGLGRHSPSLDAASYRRFGKYYYAASLLYLLILASTKLSICLLINSITSARHLRFANYTLIAITTAWAVSGIFAVAFQCDLPQPWLILPGKCLDQNKVYIYNGVLNVLTDVAICVLPIWMMWNVQTTVTKKITVCALFGSRIIVPFVVVPWLCALQTYFHHDTTDPTWYAVVPTSLAQIALNLSVMTACIPGLKGVLDTFLAGTSAAVMSRMPYTLENKAGADRLHATAISSNNKSSRSGSNFVSKFGHKVRPSGTFHSSSVTAGRDEKDNPTQGVERSESTRNLTDGVILRTDAYHVAYEEEQTGHSASHTGSRSGSNDYDEIGEAR